MLALDALQEKLAEEQRQHNAEVALLEEKISQLEKASWIDTDLRPNYTWKNKQTKKKYFLPLLKILAAIKMTESQNLETLWFDTLTSWPTNDAVQQFYHL